MVRALQYVGGAVGMGLIWAIVWAFVGVLIERSVDPGGAIVGMWAAAMAIPGFFGGVVFSALLQIAGKRCRLAGISLPQAGAWGAVSALLLGVLAVALGVAALVLPDLWLRAALVIAITTLCSAVSACALGACIAGRGKA
jgi:hypothetical protein